MADSDDHWFRLLHGVRDGDDQACQRFWDQYGPMIENMADRELSPGLRRRFGPESVALSVCRTFFRRAQAGEFDLPDTDSLWRLLCAITVNKVRINVRYHRRKKRGVDAEEHFAEIQDVPMSGTPQERVEFEEQLQSVIAGFSGTEQRVLDLRLQDLNNDQIAEKVGCAERTVRRLLKRVQTRLTLMFEDE